MVDVMSTASLACHVTLASASHYHSHHHHHHSAAESDTQTLETAFRTHLLIDLTDNQFIVSCYLFINDELFKL